MRGVAAVLVVAGLALLLVPVTSATASPVLLWPSPAFVDRDAAPQLTTWFADRLGAQADPLRPPRWEPVNDSSLPDFLRLAEAYVLPLTEGDVEARYFANGLLSEVSLRSNTTYVANSTREADLRTLADRIAADIGLDTNRANWTLEYLVYDPGGPRQQIDSIIGFLGASPLIQGTSLGALRATVRGTDLRVMHVVVSAWYDASGVPDIDAQAAIAIALDRARSGHNASDPRGEVLFTHVRNGTSFVYAVFVSWPGPDEYSWWTLPVWVDATTGEVVYEEGPALVVEDHGIPVLNLTGVALALAVAVAVLAALALFYRLTAERALDQFTRGGIFGYVLANPGSHYTKVRDALGLGNGTLAYHLWVLQRTGFVRSVRQGRLRLLYAEGVPIRKGSLVLSRLQYAILDLLHAKGPMPQVAIARHLGLSKQRTHYNVKALRTMALVQSSLDGRTALSPSGVETVKGSQDVAAPAAQPSV